MASLRLSVRPNYSKILGLWGELWGELWGDFLDFLNSFVHKEFRKSKKKIFECLSWFISVFPRALSALHSSHTLSLFFHFRLSHSHSPLFPSSFQRLSLIHYATLTKLLILKPEKERSSKRFQRRSFSWQTHFMELCAYKSIQHGTALYKELMNIFWIEYSTLQLSFNEDTRHLNLQGGGLFFHAPLAWIAASGNFTGHSSKDQLWNNKVRAEDQPLLFCSTSFQDQMVRSTYSSFPLSKCCRLISATSWKFHGETIMGMLVIDPGAAGWEGRTLPLCYATPITS